MRVPKIKFIPSTKEEKEHLQKLKKILKKKRHGDWNLVGESLKITKDSAAKAFLRVYSKNHLEAVEALENLIEKRKQLLK